MLFLLACICLCINSIMRKRSRNFDTTSQISVESFHGVLDQIRPKQISLVHKLDNLFDRKKSRMISLPESKSIFGL